MPDVISRSYNDGNEMYDSAKPTTKPQIALFSYSKCYIEYINTISSDYENVQ